MFCVYNWHASVRCILFCLKEIFFLSLNNRTSIAVSPLALLLRALSFFAYKIKGHAVVERVRKARQQHQRATRSDGEARSEETRENERFGEALVSDMMRTLFLQ